MDTDKESRSDSKAMDFEASSTTTTTTTNSGGGGGITDEEKAVYDRQIRLWGLEAQNRLHDSSVLICGLSGCGAEVAKNLILAGLKSLTLLDHVKVTENDESSQFLIAPGSRGQNRAEVSCNRCHVLNPRVALHIDTSDIQTKSDDFFKQFDLVILIDQKYSIINKVNKICHGAHIRFAAGGVYGWTGYGFFDFNDHEFLTKNKKQIIAPPIDDVEHLSPAKKGRMDIGSGGSSTVNGEQYYESITIGDDEDECIKKAFSFASWEDAMNVDWTQKRLIRKSKRILPNCYFPIRALLRAHDENEQVDVELVLKLWKEELTKCNRNFEMQPLSENDATFMVGPSLGAVCAIVGAIIGQEGIKALSQNEEPLRNVFFYSALETTGVVCHFPPPL